MDRFLIVVATVVVVAFPLFNYADSVMSYGAVGDGIHDDTAAFQKAWNDTCNGKSKSHVVNVPGGKVFMLQPIRFMGPCKPSIVSFSIEGQITTPGDPKRWEKGEAGNQMSRWLTFQNVDGLHLTGEGSLDGQGQPWWDNDCRFHPGPGCRWVNPTMLTFQKCNNVLLRGLKIINSPQTHVLVFGSNNVVVHQIRISSPGNTPNTDGIHIASSTAVSVTSTDIASGDDCVSIGDQTSNINITSLNCGPGHGVSIGSLGLHGSSAAVENIRVRGVNFTGTQNGARIKTYANGKGYVRNVLFWDLHFSSVENPIVIDQHYGCKPHDCPPTKNGVHIDKVSYVKATGTSKTVAAINLNCSANVHCTNILLESITLTAAAPAKKVNAACSFAQGTARGTVIPHSCLSS